MGDISEWLKVMLEEIERKESEARESDVPARVDKDKGVPLRRGEGGSEDDGGEKGDR